MCDYLSLMITFFRMSLFIKPCERTLVKLSMYDCLNLLNFFFFFSFFQEFHG